MSGPVGRLREFYSGTRVVVTGHTGFKGAWLSLALAELGADVTGVALPAEDADGMFLMGGVGAQVDSHHIDIRDGQALARLFAEVQPEVVFHLAAQSLVPASFSDPVETFDVNVTGTAALLAACASASALRSVVVITSDKVYENNGAGKVFVESDRLGAGDPYSASKAAAELVVASWRHSFLSVDGGPRFSLGAARAGNVIGGGDRAEARIVPDVVRALATDAAVLVRNPNSVRPWQFVLEPVLGYLLYAAALADNEHASWPGGTSPVPHELNFGPDAVSTSTVSALVDRFIDQWGRGSWAGTDERPGPEAAVLLLDSSEARRSLGWRSLLDLDSVIRRTVDWYRCAATTGDCRELSRRQLHDYLTGVDADLDDAVDDQIGAPT